MLGAFCSLHHAPSIAPIGCLSALMQYPAAGPVCLSLHRSLAHWTSNQAVPFFGPTVHPQVCRSLTQFCLPTTRVFLQANFPGKSGKGIIRRKEPTILFGLAPGNSHPLALVLFQGLADMPISVPLLLCIITLFYNGLKLLNLSSKLFI